MSDNRYVEAQVGLIGMIGAYFDGYPGYELGINLAIAGMLSAAALRLANAVEPAILRLLEEKAIREVSAVLESDGGPCKCGRPAETGVRGGDGVWIWYCDALDCARVTS